MIHFSILTSPILSSLNFHFLRLRSPEEAKGGEDAVFTDASLLAFGVSDGVGGWCSKGVDPALYSRQLMRETNAAFRELLAPASIKKADEPGAQAETQTETAQGETQTAQSQAQTAEAETPTPTAQAPAPLHLDSVARAALQRAWERTTAIGSATASIAFVHAQKPWRLFFLKMSII
jgi:hypothetical protein